MKKDFINNALSYFDEGYACAQSILLAFADRYNLDEKTASLISSTFGGGMGRLRQKCGALPGSFMVLGLAYGNINPKDMKTKLLSYDKVRELDKKIEDLYKTTICAELLKKHASEADISERRHHKIICRNVISDAAGALYDILNRDGRLP
jgi:C_GCAxxG_C_C family probable redox protein